MLCRRRDRRRRVTAVAACDDVVVDLPNLGDASLRQGPEFTGVADAIFIRIDPDLQPAQFRAGQLAVTVRVTRLQRAHSQSPAIGVEQYGGLFGNGCCSVQCGAFRFVECADRVVPARRHREPVIISPAVGQRFGDDLAQIQITRAAQQTRGAIPRQQAVRENRVSRVRQVVSLAVVHHEIAVGDAVAVDVFADYACAVADAGLGLDVVEDAVAVGVGFGGNDSAVIGIASLLKLDAMRCVPHIFRHLAIRPV